MELSPETKKEILEVVEQGAQNAIDNKLGEFYIDRKDHFLDHEWIKAWREFFGGVQNTVMVNFIRLIILFVGGILFIGFGAWIKKQLGIQ